MLPTHRTAEQIAVGIGAGDFENRDGGQGAGFRKTLFAPALDEAFFRKVLQDALQFLPVLAANP
ncbi:hypothetical protein D3C83_190310 [compost metagenome]